MWSFTLLLKYNIYHTRAQGFTNINVSYFYLKLTEVIIHNITQYIYNYFYYNIILIIL